MTDLKIIMNVFYPPNKELKSYIKSKKDILVPVNGGSGLKNDSWCSKNLVFDDTGDNISFMNPLLNEMTSIYWFWKNQDLPDRVGFFHYRRWFSDEDIEDSANYDIVVSRPIFSSKRLPIVLQYKLYHMESDLRVCVNTIMEKFDSEWGDGFRNHILHSGINYAPCNMFIMKKELFNEWCGFIFPILEELKKRICENNDFWYRDDYQRRALCFLTERLFGYWYLRKKESGLKTKEVKMVEHLDWNRRTPKPQPENPRTALVGIAKNEDHYINEWIRYHLMLGFDKVFVLQYDWTAPIDPDLKDRVITIDVETPEDAKNNKKVQTHAYNFCIDHINRFFDWVAFFDIDEFLVIKSGEKVGQWLSRYGKLDCVGVNWRYFGDSGLDAPIDGNYSVGRFTRAGKSLNRHIKSIVNTNKCGCGNHMSTCPHCTERSQFSPSTFAVDGKTPVFGPYNDKNLDECMKIAYLAHFRCKTKVEFERKCETNRNGFNDFQISYSDDKGKLFEESNQNDVEDLSVKKTLDGLKPVDKSE